MFNIGDNILLFTILISHQIPNNRLSAKFYKHKDDRLVKMRLPEGITINLLPKSFGFL